MLPIGKASRGEESLHEYQCRAVTKALYLEKKRSITLCQIRGKLKITIPSNMRKISEMKKGESLLVNVW